MSFESNRMHKTTKKKSKHSILLSIIQQQGTQNDAENKVQLNEKRSFVQLYLLDLKLCRFCNINKILLVSLMLRLKNQYSFHLRHETFSTRKTQALF